jgi:hypothetical protein
MWSACRSNSQNGCYDQPGLPVERFQSAEVLLLFTEILIASFCTLVIAAGWYYLARSVGVDRLQPFESPRRNQTRRTARRLGAWCMIVLSLSFFWMFVELERKLSPPRIALSLGFVVLSLLTMMVCVLIDVYLTFRMYQTNRGPRK